MTSNHWTTGDGYPDGGFTFGRGFTIAWNREPPTGLVGDAQQRRGAFADEVLGAVRDRIAYVQGTRFASPDFADAMRNIDQAIASLRHQRSRQ